MSAKMPYGAIVISGPTGSGKSTTLRAAMSLVPTTRRVYSFEDPIEGDMMHVIQCPIDPKSPETDWVPMTKASLRMDPDVMMYGELREKEVAAIFTRAATTGHLVYTTIHTNSAIDIIPALHDMGIPYQRLADPTFLRILGAQRLIPGLCKHCRIPINEGLSGSFSGDRLREYFKDQPDTVYIANKEGCDHCDYTGSTSDRLIAEVINVDGRDKEYILNGDTNGWLKHLKEKGWRDMKSHAELLVLSLIHI